VCVPQCDSLASSAQSIRRTEAGARGTSSCGGMTVVLAR
jgi:hypothetical protein